VLAHSNPYDRVLSDGHGIDHFEDSPIIPAIMGGRRLRDRRQRVSSTYRLAGRRSRPASRYVVV
jgi:hypothetical protein